MIKCRTIVLILIVLTFCKSYGQTNKFESGIEGGPSLIMLKGNDYVDYRNNPTIDLEINFPGAHNKFKITRNRLILSENLNGLLIKNGTHPKLS